MYLLRFSDSHITDSQGLKSVFGLVTAAVLMVKKAKGRLFMEGRRLDETYNLYYFKTVKIRTKNMLK